MSTDKLHYSHYDQIKKKPNNNYRQILQQFYFMIMEQSIFGLYYTIIC